MKARFLEMGRVSPRKIASTATPKHAFDLPTKPFDRPRVFPSGDGDLAIARDDGMAISVKRLVIACCRPGG